MVVQDENKNPYVCQACGWLPSKLHEIDALTRVQFRRLRQTYAYFCPTCYRDLKEHFDEKRSHGPTG